MIHEFPGRHNRRPSERTAEIRPATLGAFLPSAARRPGEPARFVSGLRSEDRGPGGHVLVRVPVLL